MTLPYRVITKRGKTEEKEYNTLKDARSAVLERLKDAAVSYIWIYKWGHNPDNKLSYELFESIDTTKVKITEALKVWENGMKFWGTIFSGGPAIVFSHEELQFEEEPLKEESPKKEDWVELSVIIAESYLAYEKFVRGTPTGKQSPLAMFESAYRMGFQDGGGFDKIRTEDVK